MLSDAMLAHAGAGVFTQDWHNHTTLHPLGVTATVLAGIAMLLVPLRYAVIPILLMACFVAPAQRLVILTLDLDLMRIMIIVGWLRLVIRRELSSIRLNALDVAIVIWTLISTVIWVARTPTSTAAIYQFGRAYDILAGYALFRLLIRDWSCVTVISRGIACMSVPVACAFIHEHETARNIFHIFGGVPETTSIRAGRPRCQGAFAHPILAGCFWAILTPLIASLWLQRSRFRYLAPVGVVCASTITVLSASSTPIVVFLVVIVAWLFYPLRMLLPVLRLIALLAIVALQLIMVQPIWHLVARVSFVNGSTAWYRFKLIDEFITRIDEWWIAGTDRYAQWWDWGMNDVTNQYVLEGVNGGAASLLAFLIVIIIAFHCASRIRQHTGHDHARAIIGWSAGVMLLGHCLAFIGTSYFGQMHILLSLTLGMIGSFASSARSHILRVESAGQHRSPAGTDAMTRLPNSTNPLGSPLS